MRKRRGRQLVGQNSPRRFHETSNRYQILEVHPNRALAAMTSEVLRLCTQVGVQGDLESVGPVC